MSSINYEEDQRKDLDSVNEAKSLSDQVVKLRNLEDDLVLKEKEFKELKRKQKKNLRRKTWSQPI